jgi:methane monooxygenase PmoA-like
MIKSTLITILLVMVSIAGSSQSLGKFEIDLSQETNGLDVPLTIDLSAFHIAPGTSIALARVVDKKIAQVVPSQIDKEKNTLSFIIKRDKKNDEKELHFELIKQPAGKTSSSASNIEDRDGALTITSGKENLLRYVYKKVYPPAGIDTAFAKSGFIHPLWAPHGQELTRIQPPDHYHHYGIWNPWTHVLFEGDTVDFWNIGGKQATVRFAKFISKSDGPVYSELKALHEHVVFKKEGGEKIALNEIQTIRVYIPAKGSDYFIVDFTSELRCATPSPFHIVAYRYAGFGWRATEYWTKDNSEMLTSEGKTRDNTDGSKARWCIVYGELPGNDQGGAVMLSHPDNYNHPEPLRIWDKKANNGRGDVFANFAPTKDKDWILEPGKTYTLKYRLVVFNGKMDAAKAESAWEYFAKPAEMKVKVNSQ